MQKTTRGRLEDLPVLRTPLAMHQKAQEPSFWEMMDSFIFVSI